jgi:uncharacterized protein
MKKYLVTLAAIAAFAVAPAFAQNNTQALDPATLAATKQMMSAMKIREVMQASMQQMELGMPAQLRQMLAATINSDSQLNAQERKQALAKVEKALPKLTAALHNTLSDPALLDEMIAEMVPLYARTYTSAELQQLAAFYQSPLGQKMLATMPKLMGESMQISNKVMAPRMQKLMAETRKSLED